MYRKFILFIAVLALAAPAPSRAQSSSAERAERAREKEQERLEREREAKERAAERARERAERDRDRQREREEREKAGVLDTVVAFDAKGSVSVSCPGGAVIVTGAEKNEIRVRARTENGAIRFSSNGMRATLEPASGRGCSDPGGQPRCGALERGRLPGAGSPGRRGGESNRGIRGCTHRGGRRTRDS